MLSTLDQTVSTMKYNLMYIFNWKGYTTNCILTYLQQFKVLQISQNTICSDIP